jgi:hypothetical protein
MGRRGPATRSYPKSRWKWRWLKLAQAPMELYPILVVVGGTWML